MTSPVNERYDMVPESFYVAMASITKETHTITRVALLIRGQTTLRNARVLLDESNGNLSGLRIPPGRKKSTII